MQVSNGPFSFDLVDEINLETLRELRNSKQLQEFMHEQKPVSEQEQKAWFATQNPTTDLYFIGKKESRTIGYCLTRSIDRQERSAEPGTFLLEEKDRNSSEAALFLITFMDFCHFVLGIEIFHGNVLDSNARANRNYAHFSKEVVSKTAQGTIYRSSSNTSYLSDTEKIRKAVKTIFGYEPKFIVSEIPKHLTEFISASEYCTISY